MNRGSLNIRGQISPASSPRFSRTNEISEAADLKLFMSAIEACNLERDNDSATKKELNLSLPKAIQFSCLFCHLSKK
ncbi:hypothetical protein BpHYR1_052728 [Brachionus plicatilis]|uniref:Uncharacterized protein n=1 Tax=Brachionus plicatilis TaxID=10195 RepID=A0A3M7SKP5_BRAPC|nr:hypothetical protein BpHYR1_052728 [Brachionus plicatilis]